jgi:hypothetical protein
MEQKNEGYGNKPTDVVVNSQNRNIFPASAGQIRNSLDILRNVTRKPCGLFIKYA